MSQELSVYHIQDVISLNHKQSLQSFLYYIQNNIPITSITIINLYVINRLI